MKKISAQLLLTAITCVNIVGCSNTSSLATHKDTDRIDPNLVSSYSRPTSALEEYVTRVGKRVLIVSDQPHANYKFMVSDLDTPELSLDKMNNSITVSKALLNNLNDEAELAATLTMAMCKMAYYPDLDRNSMTALARAGYDPLAMVDLQEQYFKAAEHQQGFWLSSIYSRPPTDDALATNKAFASKMSKGLLRGVDDYRNQIHPQ